MPVLCSTVLIDAEPRAVAGLLRDTTTWTEALDLAGHRCTAANRLLSPGDEVRIDVAVPPGLRVAVSLVVVAASTSGIKAVSAGGRVRLALSTTLAPAGDGTLLLDELRWSTPVGWFGDVLVVRRMALALFAARARVLTRRAAAQLDLPVIVATALVRDGRVLAAQRTRPPELAGRWELPGGRVEAGETEPDAVVRECKEELGVPVRVTGRLGTDLPIDAGVLRVHAAELEPGAPEPRALDHAALQWVPRAALASVEWVPADRAVLPDLRALLRDG